MLQNDHSEFEQAKILQDPNFPIGKYSMAHLTDEMVLKISFR